MFRASAFAVLLLAGLVPQPVFAHAILIDSTPAPLGHVPAGHLALSFRYNSRIDAARSKVTLKYPGGKAQRLTLMPAPAGDAFTATLDLAPGEYVASWQVLATDGHITRGTVPFTVDAPK